MSKEYEKDEARAAAINALIRISNAGFYCELTLYQGGMVQIGVQASTSEGADAIRHMMPEGMDWEAKFNEHSWKWSCRDAGELEGLIYSIPLDDRPHGCVPVKETVKKKVPKYPEKVEYEEQEVEVIVGWDCSGGEEEGTEG